MGPGIRRRALAMALACALAFLACAPVARASEESSDHTVRVGYYHGDLRLMDGFGDDERKSGYAYEYLQALAPLAGWEYEYVYGTRQEVVELLQAGELDLVPGLYRTDVLAQDLLFSANDMGLEGEPRYFAVPRSRPDLMAELDRAQERLLTAQPLYATNLLSTYYDSGSQAEALSEAERDWLRDHGTLRVGYLADNLPLSAQDEQGDPLGVAAELKRQLESSLKVPVEMVCYSGMTALLAGLEANEVDAVFPLSSDLWESEQRGLYQTTRVLSDRDMAVHTGSYGQGSHLTLAVATVGARQLEHFTTQYPDAEVKVYETREAAYEAVRAGEADGLVDPSCVMQRFVAEHPEYQDSTTTVLETGQDFCMAVPRGEGRLLSILNKALASVDRGAFTSAIVRTTSDTGTYSFEWFLRRNSLAVIAFLCLVFGALVLAFVAYLRKTHEFRREQAKAQEALQAAFDGATAASRAKTTFLSSMSHDIRTPMNGIVGMTAIARANVQSPARVQECLEKIDSSSRHLLALINDVLDMSKIESGEADLDEAPHDLCDLVREVGTLQRTAAEAKGQTLTVDVAGVTHPQVLCDRLRLQQVLNNLVGNAVKYTPEGGHIGLSAREVASAELGRGRFELVVSDDGVGMSPDFLPHLFEAFTREETKASAQIQGTGLGMAIVSNLVGLMGGTIGVTSELGKGSTFTVDLPLKRDMASQTEARPVESPDSVQSAFERAEECDLSGRRALLAEDNELNAEIAQEFLGLTGLVLDRATNGQEAVELFRQSDPGTYDCVFMDIQMPVMNGREATRAIRALEREDARNVPIFAMTADAFNDDRHAALNAGMNEHFAKPLDFGRVLGVVSSYLADEGPED